jgi:antitoxin component of RelBE/YafQ-DinJ toxin-antitoxin module
MGGFIRSDAERVETKQINTLINKEICEDFKDLCKVMGYPINVMVEIFMRQFVDGKFPVELDKAKELNKKAEYKVTLNTTVSLEIYNNFKDYCKEIGYPLNAILASFMNQFVNEDYVLEFKKIED